MSVLPSHYALKPGEYHVIVFEDVSKQFGRDVYALHQVTLHVQQGERVALVGANGAGKTTLIRCLLGEYPCEGRVMVAGMSPRWQRQAVLTRIGFVPQHPPPLKMSVGQLIHFAAGVCHSDPKRMVAVATLLGLEVEKISSRAFVKLSGGQKQKVLISIALGRDIEVLVMDEPAANLDPVARQLFFELLAQQRQEVVMVMSSHRLDELTALVSRVLELDRGSVVLDRPV